MPFSLFPRYRGTFYFICANVSFPDFPGCVTFGSSFEEAKIKAREVLELWLEELAKRGESIRVHTYRPIVDDIKATIPVGAQVTYALTDR